MILKLLLLMLAGILITSNTQGENINNKSAVLSDVAWEMSITPKAFRGLPKWVKNPSQIASVKKFKKGLVFEVPETGKEYTWRIKFSEINLEKYPFISISYRASKVNNTSAGGYVFYSSTNNRQKLYPIRAKKLIVDSSITGDSHEKVFNLFKAAKLSPGSKITFLVIKIKAAENNAKLYLEKISFHRNNPNPDSKNTIPKIAIERSIGKASKTYSDEISFKEDRNIPLTEVKGWDNDAVRGEELTTKAKDNKLHNGGFENTREGRLDGWSYEFHNGAKGSVEWDNTISKSGKKSLKITKSNSQGYILVYSKMPIKAANGEKISFQGFYHTKTVKHPHRTLGMVRLGQKKDDINYDLSIDKWDGFNTQQKLINCKTNQWQKRIVSRRLGRSKSSEIVVHYILYGEPATVWWDDCAVEPYSIANSRWYKKYPLSVNFSKPKEISDSALNKLISSDIDHVAEMRKVNNISVVYLDGKPVPLVIVKEGHISPFNIAGGSLTPLGVKFQMVAAYFGDIRIEDNSLAPGKRNLSTLKGMMLKKGKYNFDSGVKLLKLALKASPDAYLLIDFRLSFYKDYVLDYPATAWINDKGQKAYGKNYYVIGYADKLPKPTYRWWPSHYSKKWQKDTIKGLLLFIERLKKEGLLKRVVGFQISGGHDNQFSPSRVDYSIHAIKAFRAYLKKKYKTLASLRKSWNNASITFDTVTYPEKLKTNSRFLDPAKNVNWYDYWQFTQSSLFEIQEKFAMKAKKAITKDVLVFKYLMGSHRGAYNSNWTMNRFLKSKVFDITTPQPAYTKRDPGKSYRFGQEFKSYSLNNKMLVGEFDLRTYLRNRKSEIYTTKLGRMESYKMWQSGLRKLTGPMIAHGAGYWFFDIDWGFFRKEVAKDIADDLKIYNKQLDLMVNKKPSRNKDLLVVLDEESLYWTTLGSKRYLYELNVANLEQISALGNSGVPFDYIIMEDLIRYPELINKYKVFVFTESFKLDQARRKIYDRLKGDGRTLIWLYGAGFVSEKSKNVDNMKELTGFTIKRSESHINYSVLSVKNDHPFAKNLSKKQDHLTIERASQLLKGRKSYYDQPYFYIDDKSATILAAYQNSKKGAIGVKEFTDWTSVYVASPGGLSSDLINNICRNTGAYVCTGPGVDVALNDHFISIHGIVPGYFIFSLPRKANVRNLKTGQIIARNTDKIQMWVEPQTTYWLGIED
jgi:Beta-galactosidase